MYSISQQRIDFYEVGGANEQNYIFLVFQDGCEGEFDFFEDGVAMSPFMVHPQTIPFPIGLPTANWKYAIVDIGITSRMITVKNDCSPFSLGYFNGGVGTASYGYISGFGSMSLPFDTLWRCPDSEGSGCGGDLKLYTGIPIAESWNWYLDHPNPTLGDPTFWQTKCLLYLMIPLRCLKEAGMTLL